MSDNVWVSAEIAPPDFVAEDRDLFRARFVVFGREIAAHRGRHANDFEHVFRDITAGVALRSVLVGNVDCRSTEIAGHHRKRFLGRFYILVILRGRNIAVTKVIVLIARLGIDQADAHELFGMRKRKASQQDCVHNGELRRRAADAEPEHEHGQEAKCFLFEQDSQTNSHILLKRI